MANNAHPFAKFIYDNSSRSLVDLADKAGISRTSILRWKNGTSPRLMDLEAVLEVLGFELVVAKKHRPDFEPERQALLVQEVKQMLNTSEAAKARAIVVKISAALEGQICLDLTQECLNQSRKISEQVVEINRLIGRVMELEAKVDRFNGMTKVLQEMAIGDEKCFVAGDGASKMVRRLWGLARQIGVRIKTRIVDKDGTVFVQVERIGE